VPNPTSTPLQDDCCFIAIAALTRSTHGNPLYSTYRAFSGLGEGMSRFDCGELLDFNYGPAIAYSYLHSLVQTSKSLTTDSSHSILLACGFAFLTA
jgi:hypothetical protein